MINTIKKIHPILGINNAHVTHTERIASAVGGFIGILSILTITQYFVGIDGSQVIIASMGASSVLLFAVPHGSLSQPWSVFGGHILSAIIGVTCAQWFPNEIIAASIAVGLSIGVMHYLRCIHPPGGATALAAVVGGDNIHDLGYQFVITPIFINVCVILLVAFLYNFIFVWRRYPLALHQVRTAKAVKNDQI